MTDDTQPEAREFTMSQYASKDDMIGAMRKRIAELESELEAIGAGGVQALSAAPAVPAGWVERWHGSGGKEFWEGWSILNAANREMIAHLGPDVDPDAVRDIVAAHNEALCGECAGTGGRWCPACAGATPPAEQQATKETSGGFHVWRDISTAPKDGSRFVATGHNYGLYSEVRHTCVAQWFRGCWMEASDWNETSELKYLTHWMPLPSPPDDVAAPAEQQAAPKAAQADPGYSEKWDAELGRTAMRFVDRAGDVHPGIDDAETICAEFHKAMSEVIERMPHVQRMAAPQQEAQEPCPTCVALARTVMLDQVSFDRKPDCYGIRQITDDESVEEWEDIRTSPDVAREEANDMMATGRGEIYEVVPLYATPQPAPAPLTRDQIREVFMAHGFTIKEGQTDLKQYVYDAAYALLGTKPAPLGDDVVKDAARYRWLRDTSNADDPSHMIALHIRDEQNDASLSGIDAAIDAALAAQGDTP